MKKWGEFSNITVVKEFGTIHHLSTQHFYFLEIIQSKYRTRIHICYLKKKKKKMTIIILLATAKKKEPKWPPIVE